MKELYHPKNKFRYLYLKRILALFAIFVVGITFFSSLNSVIISFFSPVWEAENVFSRSLKSSFSYLKYKKSLVDENEALKERVSTLETKVLSLSKDESQKNTTLELLGRKQNSRTVVASVLTHPPQSPYDIIIIDAGSNESLAIGSEVSMPEGPVLGLVSEVFAKKAKVKLFSASGEMTNALLERNNIAVVLEGKGGGNFRISLPRDIAVESGDRILTNDITSRLLAIVGDIGVEPTDAFKEVLAQSPINIFNLRFVFVIP